MTLDEAPPGLLHRRLIEVAEAAAERDQVGVGQLLIPEEQHLMIEPRPMNRGEQLVVERRADRRRRRWRPAAAPVGRTRIRFIIVAISLTM